MSPLIALTVLALVSLIVINLISLLGVIVERKLAVIPVPVRNERRRK